jgi:hypothetical protein
MGRRAASAKAKKLLVWNFNALALFPPTLFGKPLINDAAMLYTIVDEM